MNRRSLFRAVLRPLRFSREALCPRLRLFAAMPSLLLLLVLTACERRPLEVYYGGTARLELYTDWLKHFDYQPERATLLLYKNGDNIYRSTVTEDEAVTHQTLYLEPAVYKMIIFNETSDIDEFPSLRFENLSSHQNAAVRAKPITTRSAKSWDAGTHYMCDPLEPIGCAVDTFTVTQDMVKDYMRFVDYRKRHEHPVPFDSVLYVLNETVEPMRTVLHVRILIKKGFNSLRSMEANISGMADGFYLSRVDRTTDTGVLLLDNWTATPIEGTNDQGWVTTDIDTYGLPFGKERVADRDSTDNVLTLAFLLKGQDDNGEHIIVMPYNVGKRMRYWTPTGDALTKAEALKHIEVEIIIDGDDAPSLPDVDPSDANASGFDAKVDDWEDGGTIEFGGF